MEQVYKRIISSRQADRDRRQQCSVLAYSNAISTTAHLFRTRIPAGYDLENKKAVSRTDY